MYLEHFQLRTPPFSEHAAATALWQDARMKEGLARLEFLLTMGELGLVTGPSGVGKSALIKRFLSRLTPQQCEVVYCHLAHLPSAGLLKFVATQLGEPPRRGKDRTYEQILERAQRSEGTLLLIFDDAHLLTSESLTDVRLLIEPLPGKRLQGHRRRLRIHLLRCRGGASGRSANVEIDDETHTMHLAAELARPTVSRRKAGA